MVRTCARGAGLAEIPPGPALGAALAELQLDELPNDQIVDVLQAQARQLAHEQARMLATLRPESSPAPPPARSGRGARNKPTNGHPERSPPR